MKNIKILVAAHKDFDCSNLPNIYEPIQVGTSINGDRTNFIKDNTQDNISDKNGQYCELTALYWGYKNLNCDISGLVHYRRYFIKKNKIHDNKYILDENDILKYLSKKKIIMPTLSYRIIENPKLYKNKPLDEQDYHLIEMEKLIKEKYPEYLKSFEKYTYHNKISWGNMFISSKDIYDQYSKFAFEFLFELEKRFEEKNKLVPRLMGFLSEILLCVWVDHNFKKSDICYLDVINTELKESHLKLRNILRKLRLYNIINSIKFNIYYKKNKY